MSIPTSADAQAYLAAQGSSVDPDQVSAAFDAEMAAQRRACRIPQDLTDPDNPVDDYPADLVEALLRRVAHNLELRTNPAGLASAVSEFGVSSVRIGGTDAEVRRLEAPWRRLVVG